MKKEKRQKGSITVFSVLTILLVMGFLLTLLEGTRINELRRIAKLRTQMAVEAAFTNYNSVLWDTYHLLGCSEAAAEALITESAKGGSTEYNYGMNLLILEPKSIEIDSCMLLTDGAGAAYMKAVAAYMKNNILYETAKTIFNQYESIKNLLETTPKDGTEIEKALESLEELENLENTESTDTNSVASSYGLSGESKGEKDNPLEQVQRLQQTQLLELVIPDTSKLSEAEYDMSESVSNRERNEGWNCKIAEADWLDRVLLQQYLLTYFADYSNPKEGRGLSYELEYLIGGADNDIDNLRTVVNELLLVRETANFVYLLSDADKLLQAELLATLLAGASANPAIIEVVKVGLLLAWAFGESVLDVRALLQGKKIPLIKGKETWTLALENVGALSEEYMVAKESEVGITYKTYLGILLLLQSNRNLSYRAMDVQEITMQSINEGCRMDDLAVYMQVTNTYHYATVFSSFQGSSQNVKWKDEILSTVEYGYQ